MNSTTDAPTVTPLVGARPHLQLTRRGRLAVFAAALIAVLALGIVVSSAVVATGDAGEPPATDVVLVQPGETLWQIASAIHPGGDIRDTVDDIMRLNALDSPAGLQMGAELHLPIYE